MSCPYLHYNMDREPSSSSAHLFEPSRARLSEHNDGRATSLLSSDEQTNPSRIFVHSWIAVIVFTPFNIGPADFQPRNIRAPILESCMQLPLHHIKKSCPPRPPRSSLRIYSLASSPPSGQAASHSNWNKFHYVKTARGVTWTAKQLTNTKQQSAQENMETPCSRVQASCIT